MINHDGDDVTDSLSAGVRGDQPARTALLSPVRAEFAARADAVVDGVLRGLVASDDRRASNRAVGDSLGVDEKRVRNLRDGAGHWMLGDVLGMGDSPETRKAALQVLETMKALILEGAPCVSISPEMRMLGIMSRTGDLAAALREAMSDGEINGDEPGRLSSIALNAVADLSSFATSMLPPPPVSGVRTVRKAEPRESFQTSGMKLGVAVRR